MLAIKVSIKYIRHKRRTHVQSIFLGTWPSVCTCQDIQDKVLKGTHSKTKSWARKKEENGRKNRKCGAARRDRKWLDSRKKPRDFCVRTSRARRRAIHLLGVSSNASAWCHLHYICILLSSFAVDAPSRPKLRRFVVMACFGLNATEMAAFVPNTI